MIASRTMRTMLEAVTAESAHRALPPAPGVEQHLALDLANSAVALPGGQFLELLGTPAAATQWLAERDLAPSDAGLRDQCGVSEGEARLTVYPDRDHDSWNITYAQGSPVDIYTWLLDHTSP